MYFDTLKTSTLEGAATTVYATGGRGNSRLVAWEGERTLTFTMEDALISPAGFMILSGAGLVEATGTSTIKVHSTETVKAFVDGTTMNLYLSKKPFVPNADNGDKEGDYIYAMVMKDGNINTEPYICRYTDKVKVVKATDGTETIVDETDVYGEDGKLLDTYKSISGYEVTVEATMSGLNGRDEDYISDINADNGYAVKTGDVVFVDYYVEYTKGVQQIEITPDKFGGNYYLEASTLFRTEDGSDLPAEFIIPNCKIQSNFNFSMASTGDPSTFTFTMDAFPDYTRFDSTKKVLAAIQVIDDAETLGTAVRMSTDHGDDYSMLG